MEENKSEEMLSFEGRRLDLVTRYNKRD